MKKKICDPIREKRMSFKKELKKSLSNLVGLDIDLEKRAKYICKKKVKGVKAGEPICCYINPKEKVFFMSPEKFATKLVSAEYEHGVYIERKSYRKKIINKKWDGGHMMIFYRSYVKGILTSVNIVPECSVAQLELPEVPTDIPTGIPAGIPTKDPGFAP